MLQQVGLAVLLAGAVALTACGGGGGGGATSKPASGAPAGPGVTLKGTDTMRFEPSTLSGRANQAMTVTLDDTGAALIHDFTIDSIGGQKVQAIAQPNGRASATFTPTAAGSYRYYCSQPGHADAGMVGTLTVS